MKLLLKKTNEVIDVVFEDCDGNVKIINKDKPELYGEYPSLKEILKEWKDVK